MTAAERVPHEILLSYAEDRGQSASIRAMARELLERRRADSQPCPHCGLRADEVEDGSVPF